MHGGRLGEPSLPRVSAAISRKEDGSHISHPTSHISYLASCILHPVSSHMSNSPNILMGVTGSIAAYKAAELVRSFKKREWDVSVVMTEGATRFVTPLTCSSASHSEVFPAPACPTTETLRLSPIAYAAIQAPPYKSVVASRQGARPAAKRRDDDCQATRRYRSDSVSPVGG